MKAVDLYLIAGQSNGAGYSRIDPEVLTALWPRAYDGTDRVLYAGRAEHTLYCNTPDVATGCNETDWTPTRPGLGTYPTTMGAEVGMANVLSAYYADRPECLAGILKFAHGGTSLLNATGGENAASGNWVSPSYAEQLGVPYEGLTGGLYRALLSQVEQRLSTLRDRGVSEIRFRGLFWMQGESDRTNPEPYRQAFACFVRDLRRDLGRIAGTDLSAFPILVGEIARTSGSADPATVACNEAFIEVQHALAAELPHVQIIPSGQFVINRWDPETKTNAVDPVQRDGWHWNTESIFAIGQLVGEAFLQTLND